MSLEFEWDTKKATLNIRKHKVSFEEGATMFGDRFSITIDDLEYIGSEPRFVTIGISKLGRIIVVIHTDRHDKIRIISARKATPKEVRYYREV